MQKIYFSFLLILIAKFTFSQTEMLLIPESTNDRVMSFSVEDGSSINSNFIPSDFTNLSTPIEALFHPIRNTILVSDQISDGVFEYNLDGTFVGLFAPAGGINTSILDNVRGIEIRPNGNLLVTVGGGPNDNAVAEFDLNGNYIGNFIANGAAGMDSPFDIVYRSSQNDYLVCNISSDNILRFDANGNYLDEFATVNTFPEQASISVSSGNVFVGNYNGTQEGILEFDSNGNLLNTIVPSLGGGYRGVWHLGNENLLITNENGVYEIDHNGNTINTIASGVSARFISLYREPTLVPVKIEYFFVLFLLLLSISVIRYYKQQRLKNT
eukprot:Anaeramoba_ignava/a90591_5.p1 GENE.a90591_5~~a90591_5.p1  ORF type:complete len:326 (-),score=-2.17 a90591_5:22-999(-)